MFCATCRYVVRTRHTRHSISGISAALIGQVIALPVHSYLAVDPTAHLIPTSSGWFSPFYGLGSSTGLRRTDRRPIHSSGPANVNLHGTKQKIQHTPHQATAHNQKSTCCVCRGSERYNTQWCGWVIWIVSKPFASQLQPPRSYCILCSRADEATWAA